MYYANTHLGRIQLLDEVNLHLAENSETVNTVINKSQKMRFHQMVQVMHVTYTMDIN